MRIENPDNWNTGWGGDSAPSQTDEQIVKDLLEAYDLPQAKNALLLAQEELDRALKWQEEVNDPSWKPSTDPYDPNYKAPKLWVLHEIDNAISACRKGIERCQKWVDRLEGGERAWDSPSWPKGYPIPK